MAESYRGLTIRIGGDTTELSKALRSANQASQQTQAELRKVGQALKLDPSSVQAYNMQLGLMTEQASNSAMRLAQLQRAMDEIGNSRQSMMVDGELVEADQTFAEIADSIDDVSQRLARSRTELAGYTSTLASMHTTVSGFSKEAAKLEGDMFAAMFDGAIPKADELAKRFESIQNYVSYDKKAVEDLVEAVRKMEDSAESDIFEEWDRQLDEVAMTFREIEGLVDEDFRSSYTEGGSYDEFSESLEAYRASLVAVREGSVRAAAEVGERMAEAFEAARESSTVNVGEISEDLQKLIDKALKFKGIDFTVDAGATDADYIKQALTDMSGVLNLSTTDIDTFIGELKKMSAGFAEADAEQKKMLKVQRYKDLQAEVVKTEASIKSMVKALSDMKAPSDVSRSLMDLAEYAKVLDAEFRKLQADTDSMAKILVADPGNMDAVNVAFRSLSDSELSVIEQARILRTELDLYDREGIDAITDGTKSAAQQLIDATQAAQKANTELATLTGTISHIRDLIDIIKARGTGEDQIIGYDPTSLQEAAAIVEKAKERAAGNDDANALAIKELEAELESLGGEYTQLVDVFGNVTESYEKVTAAQRKVADANDDLEDAKLRQEYESLSTTLVQVESRLSSVDDKARAFARSFADSSDASFVDRIFGSSGEAISMLDGAFSSATGRVSAFTTELDGAAAETADVTAHANALSEAIDLGRRLAEKLRNTMSTMDESEIDRLREQFGSVSNAAIETNESVARLVTELGQARDEMRQADSGSEAYATAKARVDELEASLEEARVASGKAASAEQWEAYQAQLAKVNQTLGKLSDQAVSVKVDNTASTAIAEQIKSLMETGFDSTGVDDAIVRLDDMAESAKRVTDAYGTLKGMLKDTPDDDVLRMQTFSAANTAIETLRRNADEARKAMSSWDASSIDRAAIATGTVGEKLAQAKRNASDAQKRVSDLEAELQKARQAFVNLNSGQARSDAADHVKQLEARLRDAEDAAKDATEQLAKMANTAKFEDATASLSKYESEMRRIQSEADSGFTTDATASTRSTVDGSAAFQQSVTQMAQYAERAGRQIVESANTIDAAYRDMRKTVNGTEEDFASLERAAIRFSQTHAVSADTLLEMEALGGQLGVVVSELGQFGEIASNLTIATDIGAEDVALQLGQMKNIMSDIQDVDDLGRFADSLVRLGNNAAATESSIMNVAQRMAAVANVTNMSTADVLAWSAAIAETGQRSESAATALTRTITGIGQAVSEGGSKLEQFATIAGTTAEDFRDKWENSSSDALEAFIKGLSTLTDDSTEALQALESVGMSSVRQEQAVLALTQTIDNLSDNMTMARDAFNGISDQWGDAGDAAREAQNKSEGFSGALSILQNNAADLAASMGDGMVPFLQAAAAALRTLTDILNALPAPLKSVVVGAGGLSAIFGTILPIVTQYNKGMGEMGLVLSNIPALMKAATGDTTALTAALMAAGTAEDAATASAIALGSALKATGIGIAFAALAAVAGSVVSTMRDMREHEENLRSATFGLTDAVNSLGAGYGEYLGKANDVSRSMGEIADSADAAIESQASLASSLADKWADVGANSAMVDELVSTIERLTEKERLNVAEQAELTAAVSAFNDATGASVAVIDSETGALNMNGGAIRDLASAWDERAKSEAAMEAYKDVYKQRTKDAMELAAVESKIGEIEAQNANHYRDMNTGIDSSIGATGNLAQKQAELRQAINSADEALEQYAEYMMGTEEALVAVEKELNAAGKSLDDYRTLTKEQLAQIATAWQSGSSDIVGYIEDLVAASNTLPEVEIPTEDMVTKFKRAQEDAYTAAKRARDDDYDSLKSDLDRKYDARKSELDREYDLAKHESDQYLKQYKSNLDEQVSAFKAATDARVEQLKREYEYKKGLIDSEEDEDTSKIDERIAEINAEQDAEDKARKQQEREEKLATLRDNVRRAKTRKARQNAEKELNDYLADLEAEDTKTARQEEIKRLEEQKDLIKKQADNRREVLKDSYDESVSNYKSSREAMLATLQAYNDAQYEEEKYAQELALQSIKDANSAELSDMKATHDAELLELKRHNEDRLNELKREQADELELYKTGQLEKEKSESSKGDKAKKDADDAEKAEEKVRAVRKNIRKVKAEIDKTLDELANTLGLKGSTLMDELGGGITKSADVPANAARLAMDLTLAEFGGNPAGLKVLGGNMPATLASGIVERSDEPVKAAYATTQEVLKQMEAATGSTKIEGHNMTLAYAIGMIDNDAIRSVASSALTIANTAASYLHFSRPDKGPLRDTMLWGAELVGAYADGMESNERRLARQAERMADIVESGFDPELTVDAGFEALDRIDAGQLRRQMAIASQQNVSNVTNAPVINITIPEVTVREEADINMLSERIALRVQREINARLG